ncbi:DUF4920 domain-containing protein [Pontibacter diazotrophicus]|uniref:DUF4920 domain-containing protein n=1 Tax=Pontibacter diazotrophicus TaxID=1400979 RepID=A0A3D8LGQ4_9BACT|nr:DUF4920 domain-containing protein [Pontibacter diazotrophicus]RDV16611.1 DUF4920 domain-containing protein [Pontibacter diazotrophicus]
MKKAFPLLFIAAVSFSCNQTKPATEAPGTRTTTTEATTGTTYGAAVSEAEAIPAAQLSEAVAGNDSVQTTVAAEVVESCQAKGCWMDVKLADNSTMKVTFSDYGFFVPVEDLKGRQVIFTGTAKREVISVEDQRHYATDAGKPETEIAAITAPKEEFRFVADGVILK